MHTASDLMAPALTVSPGTSVRELARLLLEHRADGACVTEDGVLVGVVTAMDLVFTQRTLRGPTTFALFDLVLPIGQLEAERELERATASRVDELMTRDVVHCRADATLGDVAARMVDEHITLVPVVDGEGVLLGVVTKSMIVRHVLARSGS